MTSFTGNEIDLLARVIGGQKEKSLRKAVGVLDAVPVQDLRTITSERLALLGLSTSEADRVIAALELGRRTSFIHNLIGRRIASADDAVAAFRAEIGFPEKEVFVALLLNGRHHVIRFEKIAEGCLTAAIVHPREVLRTAIQHGAAAILIMHNHPSGDATPSPEDLAITRQISHAARICAIDLLDHIILGEGTHTSMAADGLMPTAKEMALPKVSS